MNIISCLHTESGCYRANQQAKPVGIVVHSTGVNQPSAGRYAQPSLSDPKRDELIATIGKNRYGNHWNRDVDKAVHYIVGLLADGKVGIVQTLPETICAWGVGQGKKGSYNYNPTAHIQFEVCEDGLKDEAYFRECYHAAVELCADICRRYGWNESVIVSHKEAYKLGYASNHGDIDHWLKKFGMNMDDLRTDVKELLKPEKAIEVGDTVSFIGTAQYTNANATIGKQAKPCEATVLQIYRLGKSKHPYLVKGSTVYGWVNEKDVK